MIGKLTSLAGADLGRWDAWSGWPLGPESNQHLETDTAGNPVLIWGSDGAVPGLSMAPARYGGDGGAGVHWGQVLYPCDVAVEAGRRYRLDLVLAVGTSAWWVTMVEA